LSPEVGEAEPLGDGEVVDGVVDGRLTEEVLAQPDDGADAQLLGHLPDAADRLARQLQLAGVDEPQHLEHAGRRELRQVDADHVAGRELGELLKQVLAVRSQHYLQHQRTRPPASPYVGL